MIFQNIKVYPHAKVVVCACLHLAISLQGLTQEISGEMMIWHPVTLTFTGPEADESGMPNPFADYRLTVIFEHESSVDTVHGFFAADGNGAESSAVAGNK